MPEKTLEQLREEANMHHGMATRTWRKALSHACKAGVALIEAKKLVKHGQWDDWLRENFEASARTARDYMSVARHWTHPAVRKALSDGMQIDSIKAFLSVVSNSKAPVTAADELRQEIIRQVTETLADMHEEELQPLVEWDKPSSITTLLEKQIKQAAGTSQPGEKPTPEEIYRDGIRQQFADKLRPLTRKELAMIDEHFDQAWAHMYIAATEDRDRYMAERIAFLQQQVANVQPLGHRLKEPVPLGLPPHPPSPPMTANGPLYEVPPAPAPVKLQPAPSKPRYDGQALPAPMVAREWESEPITNRKEQKRKKPKLQVRSTKTPQAAKKPKEATATTQPMINTVTPPPAINWDEAFQKR